MGDNANQTEHLRKWLRLHLTENIGPITFAHLLQHFGDIDRILSAGITDLECVPGIGSKKARQIVAGRDSVDVDDELALADKLQVRIITLDSNDYPPLLRQINDPPAVLYVKGEITRSDNLAIAMVGSRNCSQYGQEQASRLSHLLAASGFTVVSGLARGIDTAAHRGALAAEGRTIAVQGRGLADVFPPENRDLVELIAKNGAVISELPLRFEPLATTFPARNRIIAGLSLGTIVVEARARSGALITARLAMEQNREVMAVPGRVDAPGSYGPHQLIKDGAVLVEKIEDVLDALGGVANLIKEQAIAKSCEIEELDSEKAAGWEVGRLKLTDAEAKVLAAMDHQPTHIDQLIESTRLTAGAVSAAVTALQLKGLIKQLPGSFYQKRNT